MKKLSLLCLMLCIGMNLNAQEPASFHAVGSRGFLNVDFGAAFISSTDYTESYKTCGFGVKTSRGYQFTPHLYAGAGMGVDISKTKDVDATIYLPIFLQGRVNFTDKRFSPFLDIKGGYAFIDAKGGYFEPSLGISCAINSRNALDIAFGYRLQRVKYNVQENIFSKRYEGRMNLGSLGFILGFSF